MIKKLTRHGNSMALVLDKPVLELLRIEPGMQLDISTDGSSLIITPLRDAKRRARFDAALRQINRRYGRTLKKLAE